MYSQSAIELLRSLRDGFAVALILKEINQYERKFERKA